MSRRKQEPQPAHSELAQAGPGMVGVPASELEDNVPKPTCPSTESSNAQKAPALALPSESKEQTVTLRERTFNCCYPGCHFKTVHSMKDLDRHLKILTADTV